VVDAGGRAVVLREKDLPDAERARLADALRAVLEPAGGVLVVAGPGGAAGGADLVHLAARDPFPDPRPTGVGRSCHSAAELTRAAAEGADWVTLSPLRATASKPGYGPALGIDGLAALLREVPEAPPAYALAGVRPADVAACRAAGAAGVAVMGAVMRDPALVAAYEEALRGAGEAAR
jgi:thiamine-phosphate pyrophosphorylase